MKIVVAPDSFKGSAYAGKVAVDIVAGWRRARPDDVVRLLPVADGGEGTVFSVIGGFAAKKPQPDSERFFLSESLSFPDRTLYSCYVRPSLPFLGFATGHFALLQNGETAIVELATAAGLTLVPAHRRDPKRTTTYGFGELIARAASVPGVKRLVLALGGSATNDGGAGALQALGVRLKNTEGRKLARGGAALAGLQSADFSCAERFPDLEIVLACDVDNPLLGDRGATAVFAPQKGATPDDIPVLEAALTRYADVLTVATGRDVRNIPGAGAAGGTAEGLLWLFPQATLRPGIEIVLDAVGFDDAVKDADIVITGEGRLDAQTLGGKVVAGVVRRMKAVNPGAKIVVIAGSVSPPESTAELAHSLGLHAVYSLVREGVTVDDAMRHAARHVSDAAERAARDVCV